MTQGEPFDPALAVETHDAITQRILNRVQSDGSTPMDTLHQDAIRMAKNDGVELNTADKA